jgi:tRNA(Ser,Leu) C12 N-acetylase TAN1
VDAIDFNLLVSSSWRGFRGASREIRGLLRTLGDEAPTVGRTLVKGLVGVKTTLDPRKVVGELSQLFEREPRRFRFTGKWVPVDRWTASDLESLNVAVAALRDRIRPGERWRMTVQKHRYTRHHADEVIAALAGLISEKVDLTHPDKIVRVDLIGDVAALAVVTPTEVFSTRGRIATWSSRRS